MIARKPEAIAAELTVPERVLLFCVARGRTGREALASRRDRAGGPSAQCPQPAEADVRIVTRPSRFDPKATRGLP
jgi:hypothetical protein